jgi:hypothetical protein
MATDNQKVEVTESVRDVDAYSLFVQQGHLKSLAESYHDFQKANELNVYCKNNFSDIESQFAMSASGCTEIDELPMIEDDDRAKILKAVLNLQPEEFDLLANSLKQAIVNRGNHCRRIDSELTALDEKQSSELAVLEANLSSEINALQQKIYGIDDDIRRKHIKLEEYQTGISTEIAFLAGSFVIGLIGGIIGAFGLTIVVFIVRAGILSIFF